MAVPPWEKENPPPALYPPERSSIAPVGFSGGASEIRRRRYSVDPATSATRIKIAMTAIRIQASAVTLAILSPRLSA